MIFSLKNYEVIYKIEDQIKKKKKLNELFVFQKESQNKTLVFQKVLPLLITLLND